MLTVLQRGAAADEERRLAARAGLERPCALLDEIPYRGARCYSVGCVAAAAGARLLCLLRCRAAATAAAAALPRHVVRHHQRGHLRAAHCRRVARGGNRGGHGSGEAVAGAAHRDLQRGRRGRLRQPEPRGIAGRMQTLHRAQ